MRLTRPCILLLVAIVIPVRVGAQTVTDGRVWVGATMQVRPVDDAPWRLGVDAMLRSRDGLDALDAWHVRPTVGVDLTSHVSVWVGYGFFRSRPATGGPVDEHRYWQQVLVTTAAAGGTFTARSRLEQRDLDGDTRLAWRFRQQLRYARPIHPGSRVSAVVWDEVAVNLRRTTRTPSGVDQNRAFAGFSVTLTPTTRIESGYSNQFQRTASGTSRLNHILLTTLGLTF